MLHRAAGNFRYSDAAIFFGDCYKVPVRRQADIAILAFTRRDLGGQLSRFKIPDPCRTFYGSRQQQHSIIRELNMSDGRTMLQFMLWLVALTRNPDSNHPVR